MTFKKGDYVLVLDDDLSGVVKKSLNNTITIETDDGFLIDFKSNELVLRQGKQTLKTDIFSHDSLSSVVLEKESNQKRKQPKTKIKERFEATMEVDLHINQLVKSSKGMTNHDMLTLQIETARKQLDFAINKRIPKIVFIHGVGEGVLKLELEYLFGRYDNVKFYEANYQKYGLGATEVYIYQNATTS
ncbi:MAG: DNA mismatch repair protein MutS [Flaviramulus sp.]|nr:DNA mismatch repair protein MutS [Flaviramulus sp.]